MEKNQMKKPKKNLEKIFWGFLIVTIAAILGLALFLALYMPSVNKEPQFSTNSSASGEDSNGENSLYERKKGFV